MASASSVIRVSIVGDTKGLEKNLTTAQGKIGGFAKGALGALAGLAVIDKTFDFAASSLEKADAMADAFDRLDSLITPAFSQNVEDVAFNFTNIGLSADEVGALATEFAAIATSAGVAAPAIAAAVPGLLDVAAAISAKTGKTVDEVVTDLGKAVAGSKKGVQDYGIIVDTALNPEERLLSILSQATTLFGTGADAANDFAGKQETLNAKWDNFSIKVGQALEGPLSGVLDFMNTMIERDVPKLADQIGDIGDDFGQMADAALGAFKAIGDGLRALNDLAGEVGRNIGGALGIGTTSAGSDREVTFAERRERERNGGPRVGGP